MAKQLRILTGQVAAITGGGRGIGRAMAEAFLREGMRVAIGDVDVVTAQRTADELGRGTVALELDVTKRESVEQFADEVERRLGPIDVFVNNAGIMPVGRFVDEDDATAHRQVDINVHGVIYGCKVALGRMLPRNRGHIVNVASQAGKFGIPGIATYVATKHAVVGLSEALRGELHNMGADGISVSVVMPNIVGTELGTGLSASRASKILTPEQVAEATVDALQTGRFDVWVPKSAQSIATVTGVLPRRGREAIARAFKADRVIWDADMGARQGYELRAAHSEPGLEPGEEPEQLPEKTAS
ncbi:MAG: SDR family oxidoreductase [Actinobacteria bacterium]|nr:MAG: SDR family oxidoreductase [Actinomycetota bacterium]